MSDPRYPIGKMVAPKEYTPEVRQELIAQIAAAPEALREAVRGISREELATPYREGGWTLRQVVHHLPDSHLNAYTRFKLALTEDNPTIKPYDEAKWAELADTRETDILVSVELLDALHRRWVTLLRGMSAADFSRTIVHPEAGAMNLDRVLSIYAWHGRHHVAHITTTRRV